MMGFNLILTVPKHVKRKMRSQGPSQQIVYVGDTFDLTLPRLTSLLLIKDSKWSAEEKRAGEKNAFVCVYFSVSIVPASDILFYLLVVTLSSPPHHFL